MQEVLWVEEIVTITASEPTAVATPGWKRHEGHLRKHRRDGAF